MATITIKASASITVSIERDVTAVWRFYKLNSSSSTPSKPTEAQGKAYAKNKTVPSGWGTTEPKYDGTSTNSLYTVDLTIFSDDNVSWSDVSKSTAYEAAKEAVTKADNASAAAGTAQAAAEEAQESLEGKANLVEVYLAGNTGDTSTEFDDEAQYYTVSTDSEGNVTYTPVTITATQYVANPTNYYKRFEVDVSDTYTQLEEDVGSLQSVFDETVDNINKSISELENKKLTPEDIGKIGVNDTDGTIASKADIESLMEDNVVDKGYVTPQTDKVFFSAGKADSWYMDISTGGIVFYNKVSTGGTFKQDPENANANMFQADLASIATMKFREAKTQNPRCNLGMVAQSNGHVSFKEV